MPKTPWTIHGAPTFDGTAYRIEVARGTDDDGRPLELRAFDRPADDPRNFTTVTDDNGHEQEERRPHDEVLADLRAEAKAQIAAENARTPPAPEGVEELAGAGETL